MSARLLSDSGHLLLFMDCCYARNAWLPDRTALARRQERVIVLSSSIGELLFVYGSLRKDSKNDMHQLLARNSTFVGAGRIQGELYDLGTHPGVVIGERCSDTVVGEVYALTSDQVADMWQVLDRYEGCGPDDPGPHEYRRQVVRVILDNGDELDAWAYILATRPRTAVSVPGADYIDWQRQKQDQ
jgi:gamma-glutamylcyclotransferase (GGCT)/AIG2-like uncharacterized protein YtfP